LKVKHSKIEGSVHQLVHFSQGRSKARIKCIVQEKSLIRNRRHAQGHQGGRCSQLLLLAGSDPGRVKLASDTESSWQVVHGQAGRCCLVKLASDAWLSWQVLLPRLRAVHHTLSRQSWERSLY